MTGCGDRFQQVRNELRAGTHERGVVVGAWVVGAQDEALKVVDVRVQAVVARPLHDLARDIGLDRRVEQQLAEPTGVDLRHRPDEAALVADDRSGQAELAREAQGRGHHPAGDERDRHVPFHGRCDCGHGPWPDLVVVADQRPVDIEGDQADRELRSRRGDRYVGQERRLRRRPGLCGRRRRRGGRPRRPGAAPRRHESPRRTIVVLGRPARSVSTDDDQPGRRSATSATIASP